MSIKRNLIDLSALEAAIADWKSKKGHGRRREIDLNVELRALLGQAGAGKIDWLARTRSDGRISAANQKTLEDFFGLPVNAVELTKTSGEAERLSYGFSSLPNRLPDFVGRRDILNAIAVDLEAGRNIVLAGMGGVGKTTVAIEAAHNAKQTFVDGIYFVDARGMNANPLTVSQVAQRIVQIVDPLAQATERSTWEDIYRRVLKNRRCLLLLDNLRHVDLVHELGTPNSARIIVTTRPRFAFPGAHSIDVDQMSESDAVTLLKCLTFDRSFKKSQLQQLSLACGALPIALRAAATYIVVHKTPLDEYLTRLADARSECQGLSYLSQVKSVDRSLDVEAVLSLSLERLLEDDRNLAMRYLDLVQFPSDFDASAVAAIWDLSESKTMTALDHLVARSLVERDILSERLRLHDLLKDLAHSQLVN